VTSDTTVDATDRVSGKTMDLETLVLLIIARSASFAIQRTGYHRWLLTGGSSFSGRTVNLLETVQLSVKRIDLYISGLEVITGYSSAYSFLRR